MTLIILISHIAQLLLILKFYFFRPGPIFPLTMRNIIIYFARLWDKYLLIRNKNRKNKKMPNDGRSISQNVA